MLGFLLKAEGIQLNLTSGYLRRTALYWAVLRCSPAAARLLLNRGAERSIRDTEGKTALDLAAVNGPKELRALAKEIRGIFEHSSIPVPR
ncbi:hypothetical protein BJY04DRAFT_193481 [Aspergillus karnatakaensis]|uniref:uncharacterized protein n=1 Tax=Aspergillus karnatakaensis TaxID=1810916 RepID=UPI003CCCB7DA